MSLPSTERPKGRVQRRTAAARVAGLFDQHATMVLGLCRLLLRDHHEAEDAAQQTFVSAYRSLLRGTEPRDAAPWLAAIARNECRARVRRRMRTPVALESELDEQLADPADVVDEADRRAELTALTAAIAELPARQREAVALRDFLGLSYEEVASTLSVSVPVVESLLFRARRRLRETVRTVPRYAAGLVALPLTIKATISRELPDADGLGLAGAAGAAGAAIAGIAAKTLSLPFASKAATAVTVMAMATVVPQLGESPGPTQPPAEMPTAAGLPAGPEAPTPARLGGAESSEPEKAKARVENEDQDEASTPTPSAQTPPGSEGTSQEDETVRDETTNVPETQLDPTREIVSSAELAGPPTAGTPAGAAASPDDSDELPLTAEEPPATGSDEPPAEPPAAPAPPIAGPDESGEQALPIPSGSHDRPPGGREPVAVVETAPSSDLAVSGR